MRAASGTLAPHAHRRADRRAARRSSSSERDDLQRQLAELGDGLDAEEIDFDENFADSARSPPSRARPGARRQPQEQLDDVERRPRPHRRGHLRHLRGLRQGDRRGPARGHAGTHQLHRVAPSLSPPGRRPGRRPAPGRSGSSGRSCRSARRAEDRAWAVAQLLTGRGRRCGTACPAADRRHAAGVARRVEPALGAEATRPVLAAALLHDVRQDRVRPRHLRPGRSPPCRPGRPAATGRGLDAKTRASPARSASTCSTPSWAATCSAWPARPAHRRLGRRAPPARRASGPSRPRSAQPSRPPTTTDPSGAGPSSAPGEQADVVAGPGEGGGGQLPLPCRRRRRAGARARRVRRPARRSGPGSGRRSSTTAAAVSALSGPYCV